MSDGSEAGQLRRDIQHTRTELGATVQALAGRADVKARVGHAAGDLATEFREVAYTAGQRAIDTGRRLSRPPLAWVLLGATGAVASGVVAVVLGRKHRMVLRGRKHRTGRGRKHQTMRKHRTMPKQRTMRKHRTMLGRKHRTMLGRIGRTVWGWKHRTTLGRIGRTVLGRVGRTVWGRIRRTGPGRRRR